jgi:hypothetical protein
LSKLLALLVCLASCLVSSPLILRSGEAPAKAEFQWDKVLRVSKTSVSIQDCPEPPLRRGRPTHDPIYKALRADGVPLHGLAVAVVTLKK